MDRLTASWDASQRLYDERITKGSFPSMGLDSLPTGLAFLNPHKLEAIVAANIAYLAIVFVIVRFVKSNGPVSDSVVKPFMLLYNAACVVLAGAVTVGILHYKLTVKLGSFACNIPDLGTPAGERLAWYIWLYYAQKYWEYLDTVIFALRGSFRQLSFLHVYHHVSITFVTSAFLRHDVNGDCYAAALANSFIHVLMYSHYFCSALGVNAWWRKHLTSGKSSPPPPLPTPSFPLLLACSSSIPANHAGGHRSAGAVPYHIRSGMAHVVLWTFLRLSRLDESANDYISVLDAHPVWPILYGQLRQQKERAQRQGGQKASMSLGAWGKCLIGL